MLGGYFRPHLYDIILLYRNDLKRDPVYEESYPCDVCQATKAVLKAQAALDKAIEALEGFDDKNFPESKGYRKVTYILPDLTTENCTVGDLLC